MKLAVLADIHGNLQALDAVLKDADEQGAERIIVNGDMVNRGPNGVAVMERLQEEGVELLLGNHDDLMRKWTERDADLPQDWFESPFWRATAWAAEQLDEAGWIDEIRKLPMTRRVDIPGLPSVLISHGSPRHYREGYSKYLPDESLSEILQMHPADVLLGSHTHQPLDRHWGKSRILNTGAVGAPFNGDARAQYLILRGEDGSWTPDFRQVGYDRGAALRAFETSGLLTEGALSAELFYLELKHARSFLTPFWMWTEERGLEQTQATWTAYREVHPERFTGPEFV